LLPDTWLWAAITTLGFFALAQLGMLPANGDASWYLYMAGKVLDGARLYVDVVDTNPPLIVLLSMGIVGVARVVGVSALVVLPTVLLILTAVSLALSWQLSKGLPMPLRQASLLVWGFLLLVFVGGIFGQREHLLLILVLPYAMAAVAEAGGTCLSRTMAILVGAMAGVGFALKPFFVIPALLIEAFLALRRGPRVWRQPRAVTMRTVWVLYAIVMIVWTPQYFAVARRFAPLYPHHSPMGPALLSSSWRLVVIATAIVVAARLARGRVRDWACVFGLLTIGATAAVYLTGKGWRYHWFPAMSSAIALLAGCATVVASTWESDRRRARMLLLVAVVLPALSVASINEWVSLAGGDPSVSKFVHDQIRPNDSLLVLSPWVNRSFPLVNETGANWAMRHPMLWQIAAFHVNERWRKGQYHSSESMSPAERDFVSEIVDDFVRNRPVLLLVDRDPPTPALKGFDYLEYFRSDRRFAEMLTCYEFAGGSLNFRVFRLVHR
jgi:hypothetical protein